MKQLQVGVDPGASGAIVWRLSDDPPDVIHVHPMPKTPRDIFDLVGEIQSESGNTDCAVGYMENVGGYRPGNSGPASVKFARHCGHLDMALAGKGLSTKLVAPNVWMKKFLCGNVPKDKGARKNAIKWKVQQLYPAIRVTLWNADAIALLHVMTN